MKYTVISNFNHKSCFHGLILLFIMLCREKILVLLLRVKLLREKKVIVSFKTYTISRPKARWYLDGVEITESRNEFSRAQENEDYKLIINTVSTDLKGKYTCKLQNDLGEDNCDCSVTVNCKYNHLPKSLNNLLRF